MGKRKETPMIAFVCSSPVQVMRAVHMKMRYEICADSADLFITYKCPGYQDLADQMKKNTVFSHVYVADTSNIKKHVVARLLWGNSTLAQIVRHAKYEKLFTFNIEDELGQALYNANRHLPHFEHHCVEDAPNIYAIYEPPVYKWYHPFKWFGMDRQAYHITNWWTSCPQFINLPESFHTTKKKLLPIDINDNEYVEVINFVFKYETNEALESADILIMDESHYTDGLMIDDADYRLYQKIQAHYPSKNFIVKLHPRTRHNRYINEFKIMEKSSIPWELFALNRARNNAGTLIQISIACSTMMSDLFLFGIEGKKIIMAPLFYNKLRVTNNVPRISEADTRKYKLVKELYREPENFVIADTEEDIFLALDRFFDKS